MKKLSAIFFLLLFLFNLYGYRLIIGYTQRKQKDQLVALLDKNEYEESQIVELKIPRHLPYQSSSSCQRYDGDIEINGILYRYVKRKVDNDTLFIMCIANTKKMQLETSKNDFFGITNGLVQSNSPKKPDSKSAFRNLQSEYDLYSFILNINNGGLYQQNLWLLEQSQNFFSAPHNSPGQPPDLSAAQFSFLF